MDFLRSKKKTEEELSATLDTLGSLAGIRYLEATDAIKNLLEQNKNLDPYITKPGKNSPFSIAFDKGNIESLYAIYQHKPDSKHKHLLNTLASDKLAEEIEKSSPDFKQVEFLLKAGAKPTKQNKNGQSALDIANKMAEDQNDLELLYVMSPYLSSKEYSPNRLQNALFREVVKEKPSHKKIQFLLDKEADPFLGKPNTGEIAFDLLPHTPHNLNALHSMYRKLPRKLEGNRASYSKTLTKLVENRLQQHLVNHELNEQAAENSLANFNKTVAAAEKSKLPNIGEYAAELMAPHFNQAFKKEQTYTVDHYYQDNPGVLVFEDLSERLGEKKAQALKDSPSIEIASDDDFKKYILAHAKDIINEHADITADNKYTFLKKTYPNLSEQELLDKLVPKKIQQNIFHVKHPNKILEDSVSKIIGEENLESFKTVTKQKVLTDSQVTEAIEQKQADNIQEVEAFLDRNPLLSNDSYYSQGPRLINLALNNIDSNPQILKKTIELIKEQNKNNPDIVKDMVKKVVDRSNNLDSPTRALELHSILIDVGIPLPDNYKIGQLSTQELQTLETFANLTQDKEKFLKGDCSLEEMKQLHREYSKLPLEKLPKNLSGEIISLVQRSTPKFFDKQLETSENIVEIIEGMVEISKNSKIMLAIHTTETPELLRNRLTLLASRDIMSGKEKSPTKLHKQKMADHEKTFYSQRKELNANIKRIEKEITQLPPAMQLSNAANLMVLDAKKSTATPDELDLYSAKRQEAIDGKEAELKNAIGKLDKLNDDFNEEKLKLQAQLKGKELSQKQKIYNKKLEQFHQFLLRNPNLRNVPQEDDKLAAHVLNIAIENIEQKPEMMKQVITLFKDQYSEQDLIKQMEDYRDDVLKTEEDKQDIQKIQDYFDKAIALINEHYKPNNIDANATLTQELALLAGPEELETIAKVVNKSIINPGFPQISDAIRAKLFDPTTTSEQSSYLTTVLVDQLNENPPLNIRTLQSLHDKGNKKELENLLRNAKQFDISHVILNANDELARSIYDLAPSYKVRHSLEAAKLVNIAIKTKNEPILDKVIDDISSNKELLSIELLQSLYKAEKLDKILDEHLTLDQEKLTLVLNTIINNSENVDPDLICDILEKTKDINKDRVPKIAKKLSEVANIVLSDEKKIANFIQSEKNINNLARHYNSSKHHPLFLKKLIDLHDTTFKHNNSNKIFSTVSKRTVKNIVMDVNASINGGYNQNPDLELPKGFEKKVEKYLKTKRSVFKAFVGRIMGLRDEKAQMEKRIEGLKIGANEFNTIMDEWKTNPDEQKTMRERFMSAFGFSKKHKKTLTLDAIMTPKELNKVIKDAANQKAINPNLANKIFSQAILLGVHSDDSVNSVMDNLQKLAQIVSDHKEKIDQELLSGVELNNGDKLDNSHLVYSRIEKLFEKVPEDKRKENPLYIKAKAKLEKANEKNLLEDMKIKQQQQKAANAAARKNTAKTETTLWVQRNVKSPLSKAQRNAKHVVTNVRDFFMDHNPVPTDKVEVSSASKTPPSTPIFARISKALGGVKSK